MLNQSKNIFDDQYSLSYRKIERPKPAKGFWYSQSQSHLF
jgi:hypothetical protein